jgi:hypothetical protein
MTHVTVTTRLTRPEPRTVLLDFLLLQSPHPTEGTTTSSQEGNTVPSKTEGLKCDCAQG